MEELSFNNKEIDMKPITTKKEAMHIMKRVGLIIGTVFPILIANAVRYLTLSLQYWVEVCTCMHTECIATFKRYDNNMPF